MPTVWMNGELMDATHARTSALDRGLVWGWGLFETLRAYGGRLWAFDEHMARMRRGARVLDLTLPDAGTVQAAMHLVMSAEGLEDCGVRVMVTAASGPPDPHSEPDGPPNTLVSAWPLRDYSDLYRRGARLISMSDAGRPLAGVKSTSYAVSVAGRVAARRAGADDALLLDADGSVLETTGSNVMVLSGGQLVTPPSAGVLPGVTRATVIAVAAENGLDVTEARLGIRDLREADEVILTSTLREVYGACELDREPLSTGPVAGVLRRSLGERIRRLLEV